MGTTTVVEVARRALGPVGVFLPFSRTSAISADLQRATVRRLERVGYRATWTNEAVGGKDALVQLAVLLAATERMVFGTGIANIWARQPQTTHGAAALLAQAFPGRFVLGLGVGYPQQAASTGREFGSPVATMRDYVDQMTVPAQLPTPDVAYPKIIGANGPKMLALSGEIADGGVARHGAARVHRPGPAAPRPGQAPGGRAGRRRGRRSGPGEGNRARQRVADRLGQPGTYAATMARLGYTAREIIEVSDRLVDGIVGYGDAAAIAAKVREHLAAGADHVMVMVTGIDFVDSVVNHLEQLAPTLVEFTS